MVLSDSLVVPELILDAELIPDVALELTEQAIAFWRCLTELLGEIVFNPRNFIAWNKKYHLTQSTRDQVCTKESRILLKKHNMIFYFKIFNRVRRK